MTTSSRYGLNMVAAAGSNPPMALNAADVPVQDSPGVAAVRQLFGEPFSGGAGPAEEGNFETVHAPEAAALPQPGAGVMRTGASQAASPAVAAAGTPPRMPMIQKQYIGTPAEQIQKKMDDDAVRVERMQKKIEELEELIKELLKSKGGGAKDAEVDEELLKP